VSRAFSGSHTGLTVSAGLVGKGKLSQISSDHIEFDFDVVEGLAVVDCNVVTNHFGENDGISEMSLDRGGLFSQLSVLLRFFAFSVETNVSVFNFCFISMNTS